MVNYQVSTDAVFNALADATRRAMVERLTRESMPVARLAEPFPISAPAISKHLRVLERAGLLEREIQGRTHICHLRGEGLAEAVSWLDEQGRFWAQSLDRLESYFRHKHTKGKRNVKRRNRKP